MYSKLKKMARYWEGLFRLRLLFMFTSSLVLHHFVNPKLTEIHRNIYLQFPKEIYFCFSAFGNVTTDVPKPLDVPIVFHLWFLNYTILCQTHSSVERKIPRNRDLQNQLENVRDFLISDHIISCLWHWLDMAMSVINKYI